MVFHLLTVYLQATTAGDLFGWVQTLMENLGVWDDVAAGISALIIIGVTAAILRFIR